MYFISIQSTLISIVFISKGAVFVGPLCILLILEAYCSNIFFSFPLKPMCLNCWHFWSSLELWYFSAPLHYKKLFHWEPELDGNREHLHLSSASFSFHRVLWRHLTTRFILLFKILFLPHFFYECTMFTEGLQIKKKQDWTRCSFLCLQ